MKKWVKPFLIKEVNKVQISEELKKMHRERITQAGDKEVAYDLVGYLNCDCGNPFDHYSDYFINTLGTILSSLPKSVFLKLKRMRNLFFVFTPFRGAEVKIFNLEKIIRSTELRIVTFPFSEVKDHPLAVLIGSIVHELAHVYLEHKLIDSGEDIERAADELAIEWGFGDAIKTMRDFENEMYLSG